MRANEQTKSNGRPTRVLLGCWAGHGTHLLLDGSRQVCAHCDHDTEFQPRENQVGLVAPTVPVPTPTTPHHHAHHHHHRRHRQHRYHRHHYHYHYHYHHHRPRPRRLYAANTWRSFVFAWLKNAMHRLFGCGLLMTPSLSFVWSWATIVPADVHRQGHVRCGRARRGPRVGQGGPQLREMPAR